MPGYYLNVKTVSSCSSGIIGHPLLEQGFSHSGHKAGLSDLGHHHQQMVHFLWWISGASQNPSAWLWGVLERLMGSYGEFCGAQHRGWGITKLEGWLHFSWDHRPDTAERSASELDSDTTQSLWIHISSKLLWPSNQLAPESLPPDDWTN